ncbi:MAG: ABC transporter ATP-binding protein [Lachnospiraceae bacterium]|nr:ABC transporter ATP-binding protein [Lachnospiraceae bacterium]
MKELLKYLEQFKKECILAPLFKMLEAVFELFVPLVVARIIDRGIGEKDPSSIVRYAGIMIVLGIVGLLSAVTAQYFSAKAATGFSKALRRDLFKHLLGLSHRELDGLGTSTMITRITSDVLQAQTGVNMFLRLFLRSPFIVFGAMIMAFTIDVRAALLFVLLIVVLFAVVAIIMRLNIPMLARVQQRLDKITLLTRENLSGSRVIRAFCLEESEEEGFREQNTEYLKTQIEAGHISALLNPLTYVIVNLMIILLIYTGAVRVQAGALTQGMVVALYNYMSQILVELVKFANLILTINKAIASGNRIADVFRISNSLSEEGGEFGEELSETAVEFENVSFTYHEGGDEALSDVSFLAKRGATIGIIGGTGSGKSTLAALIPRFYDVSKGVVRVFGKDVRSLSTEALRDKIGIVPQKAVLFQGTIADNLRWGRKDVSDKEMEEAIELAAAADIVSVKGGLLAEVAQNGSNFSGGQKQRLTIARALVKKPELLILDDSSSALDFVTDLQLRTNIRGLSYHPTTFLISQRTSTIRNADLILVMDDGLLVGKGTHEELLANCEVYREIHESQFSKEEVS